MDKETFQRSLVRGQWLLARGFTYTDHNELWEKEDCKLSLDFLIDLPTMNWILFQAKVLLKDIYDYYCKQ